MQLREAKPFRVLDHHDGGLRNIDADFDHGRRHQHLNFTGSELRHDAIFLAALHLAVHQTDAVAETLLQTLETLRRVGQVFDAFGFGFLHQGADPVNQLAAVDGTADCVDDLAGAAIRHRTGIDRLATGGFLSRSSEISMSPK